MNKIITILLVICSSNIMAQTADRKNINFENGDAICSSNGKILGGNWVLGNNENIQNFIGIFSKPENQSNSQISDIFQSKGFTFANIQIGQTISKGDYVTIVKNGKVSKLIGQGLYIGTAIEDGINGKVKIVLSSGYKN